MVSSDGPAVGHTGLKSPPSQLLVPVWVFALGCTWMELR